MNPATATVPGQRVGNYILEEKIGQGAFAEIWRANHHERPNRPVAVKIPIDPAFRRQLSREGRLPEIEHPNIVPILDSDTRRADPPYIVMPLLSGGNLSDRLNQHPEGLPEDDVSRLLEEVLAGLSAAHQSGVVHNDIKPQNILFDDQGRAHITDFGLSKVSTTERLASVMQSTSISVDAKNSKAGTPAYMAPEILEGGESTPAADVYSTGMLLFELLTGRRAAGMELPSQRRPDLKRAYYWDRLFYWACQPRDRRYSDATAMLQAAKYEPKPLPSAAAKIVTPQLDDPTPVEGSPWEALPIHWDTLWEHRQRERELNVRIGEALGIYEEKHPEVNKLRAAQLVLEANTRAARERLDSHCRSVKDQLTAQIASLEHNRATLVAEGCLPNHPSVEELDRAIDSLHIFEDNLAKSVLGKSPLGELLRDWLTAKRTDTVRRFLEVHGSGPENPLSQLAKSKLQGWEWYPIPLATILSLVVIILFLVFLLRGCPQTVTDTASPAPPQIVSLEELREMFREDSVTNMARPSDSAEKGQPEEPTADAPPAASGATTIIEAAEKGETAKVIELLDQGGDVNARNDDGATPLCRAAYTGALAMAKLLVEHGANIDATTNVGNTALHYTTVQGSTDVAKFLLEKGADIDASDQTGNTPLAQAAYNGYFDLVEMFLDSGADVNAKNKTNDTPVYWAVYEDHFEIVDLLLTRGANPNVTNDSARTPLSLAIDMGSDNLVELLKQHGAKE